MNVFIVTDCPAWLELKELARDGEPIALAVLADALRTGDDCEADLGEAMRIYAALAFGGDAAAMSALGDLYLFEVGDGDAALAWYRKAADAGDRRGRSRLVSLLTASGDDAEVAEGIGWAWASVQHGDPDEREFVREQLAGFLGGISAAVLAASDGYGRRSLH